ncbi:MAG: hypothetical protein KatS3mg110_0173 [Pirellulaceae bacterium]|nr:MAG: hypothetical protein KatS3mg110_0173 [Pirellulaceae bacterium]
MMSFARAFVVAIVVWVVGKEAWSAEQSPAEAGAVRVGFFDVDASPPIGSPLAYDPCVAVEMPLHCKGIVLIDDDGPIVLVSVDWIGIANDGYAQFRKLLAEAVATSPDRVAVHAIHQHDAPECDLSAAELLRPYGLTEKVYDIAWQLQVMRQAAQAASQAKKNAQAVTHVGFGKGEVQMVASNRRILGPDGKVQYIRWTATRDPQIRAMPVGTIDPYLRLVTFWHEDRPLVAMTYYACHPQSYYRTGKANPDFPGMARETLQQETGTPHIHFNGAGGNIGAGKWNDGSPENRPILANRVAEGMRRAWQDTKRYPLKASDVAWQVVRVRLPAARFLEEKALLETLGDEKQSLEERKFAARSLAWLRRSQHGDSIDVACLYLGDGCILHMPGELFVEYQLAAQKIRPDRFVAMAAYGDYGPGYIGTAIAYEQGGYETSRVSRVAPEVEPVLLEAIETLLKSSSR